MAEDRNKKAVPVACVCVCVCVKHINIVNVDLVLKQYLVDGIGALHDQLQGQGVATQGEYAQEHAGNDNGDGHVRLTHEVGHH